MTEHAIPDRVTRVEADVAQLRSDVADLGEGQKGIQAQLATIIGAVTTTDGRAVAHAEAVETRLRLDGERKARDRNELFKNGATVLGAIVLVVGAIGGPYLNKLNATASGQEQNTKDLSAVRELIASDHAEMMRNRDSIDVSREKNKWQDEHLFDLAERQAYADGVAGRTPHAR